VALGYSSSNLLKNMGAMLILLVAFLAIIVLLVLLRKILLSCSV